MSMIRTWKPLVVLCTACYLALVGGSVRGEQLNANALRQRVHQTLSGVKAFEARFTQLNSDSLLNDTPQEASGRLHYAAGGLMRWEYAAPDEQLIIIGKEHIWVYDPLLNTVSIQTIRKTDALESLSFFREPNALLNKFNTSEVLPKSRLEITEQEYFLRLVPRKKNAPFSALQFAVESESFMISAVAVEGLGGELRVIRFHELRLHQRLTPDRFEFVITPEMEVIKN